jgi:plastocyanin
MRHCIIASLSLFSVHAQSSSSLTVTSRFNSDILTDFTSMSSLVGNTDIQSASDKRISDIIQDVTFKADISIKIPDIYTCGHPASYACLNAYDNCNAKCMNHCERLRSVITLGKRADICVSCIENCCPQLDIVVETNNVLTDVSVSAFVADKETQIAVTPFKENIRDLFEATTAENGKITLSESYRRKYYYRLDYNQWNNYLQPSNDNTYGDPCVDTTDGGLYYRTLQLNYNSGDSYKFRVPIYYIPPTTGDACCEPYVPTEIDVVGISFSPSTVSITEGNVVTWKALPTGHNVRHTTAACVEASPSLFRSHYIGDWQWTKFGYEFLHTFTGTGSYPFMCSPHCATGGMTGSVTVNPAGCSLNYGWQYYKEGQCVFVGHCLGVSTPYKYATEEACLESCCDPVNDCPATVWPQADADCPSGYVAEVPDGKCCKECVEGSDPCDDIVCDLDPVPAAGCLLGQHSETYNDGCCSTCEDDVVVTGDSCTVSGTTRAHGDTWHEGCRECECVDGVAYCCNVYPELHDVSTAQKTRIAQAFKDANGGSASNVGTYTDLVNLVQAHLTAFSPAHGHAWFLPWHRAYIAQLNQVLQDNSDSCVNVPYWDWTLDEGERPVDGNIPAFDPVIMGTTRDLGTSPADSRLKDGMFACDAGDPSSYWVPHVPGGGSLDFATTNCLQRRYNENNVVTFDTASEVDDEINDNNDFTSFYVDVEGGSHIPPHTYVRGHMTTGASSFDPLFFMHHNMIDKVWDDWQKKSGGLHQYDYDEELVPFYQPLNGMMDIVGATPADTLNIERMCFLNETDSSGTTICICARHAVSGETPPVGTLSHSKPKLQKPHYTDFSGSKLTAVNRAKMPAASIFRPRASNHVITQFGLNREHLRRREREKANKYKWSNETDGLFRKLSDWNARGGYQSAEKQIDADDELFELDTVPNGAPDDKKESRVWSTLVWYDSSQSDYDYNDIVLHINHAVTETGTNLIITVVQNGASAGKTLQLYSGATLLSFSRGLHNNGAFLPWHRGYILNNNNVDIKDTLAPVIRIGLKEVVLFSELQFKINGKSPTKYAGERRLLNIAAYEYPALPPRKLEEGVVSEIEALRERLLEKQKKHKEEFHAKPGHCDLDNTIGFIRKFPKEVTQELMKSC